MKIRRLKIKKGFTLVEMIMVLIVIMIVYSFAAPTLSRFNVRKKLQFEAGKVANVIEVARSASTTNREKMEVVLNTTNQEFYYRTEGSSNYLDKKHHLDSSVVFSNTNPSSLVFKISGAIDGVSSLQTITLEGGSNSKIDITVNHRTGKVSVGEIYS